MKVDPKYSLLCVTWNCGGMTSNVKAILEMIVKHCPHIVSLQETRNRSGNHSALTAECKSMVYAVSPYRSDGLVCMWKRGLNGAPIRLKSDPKQSDEFKVQSLVCWWQTAKSCSVTCMVRMFREMNVSDSLQACVRTQLSKGASLQGTLIVNQSPTKVLG